MKKSNHKALQVTIALLVCLLIAGTTTSDWPALAALPEASGAGQSQLQVKNQAPGQPGQPDAPVGSGFTYQGSLKSGGSPANGQYDFTFKLYDALSGGGQVGSTFNVLAQTVSQGLFTVLLDFGQPAFQGDARYIEIAVRQTGGGTYTILTPRQALTPAPYALSLKPEAVIRGTTGSGAAILGAVNSGSGYGMYGESTASNGTGLRGVANYDFNPKGVYGSSDSGYGVYGSSINGYGVYGESINHLGVEGISTSDIGVYGQSYSFHAVYGESANTGDGVHGVSLDNGRGVYGRSENYEGVRGETSSNFAGVFGYNVSTGGIGPGVRGDSVTGPGVYGTSTSGWAGYFQGNVNVTGSCCLAAQGTYRIDHPQDPANKYLNQSAVESRDMKTIYDGIATLDAAGEAWVEMPPYAQSLNEEFRYQLTPIGAPGRDLYVAQEIQNNRFKVAGGTAGMKVSWQVTGTRHDPYAVQNPVTVEQDKPAGEKGKYLHPEVYGQPETLGIGYEQSQRVKQAVPPIAPTKPGR